MLVERDSQLLKAAVSPFTATSQEGVTMLNQTITRRVKTGRKPNESPSRKTRKFIANLEPSQAKTLIAPALRLAGNHGWNLRKRYSVPLVPGRRAA
jgi:hypothetical protein